jgi:WD40 repeat protein
MRHYPTWLILFFVGLLLAGCVTANQATPTTSRSVNIPSAAPLPAPQAIDLGVLGKGTASDVAWSPDGRLMAVASTGGVFLYDTQTWQVQQTIPQSATDNNTVSELVFSPDGKMLVSSLSDGRIQVFGLPEK